MIVRFCYTLTGLVGKNWPLAIMSPTKKLRILLVSVDLPTRRVARSLIEKNPNWRVVGEPSSVGCAVESAPDFHPDLIVLDQDGLNGQGVPLINRLLLAVPNCNLLLLTSRCSERDIRASLRAGATGFLSKSELETRFISAVRHTASGQRFLSGQLARLVLRRFLDSAVERTNARPSLSELTPRELEIVRLISLGNGNKQVAAQLGIAVRTAEVHRANAMKKLNLHGLAELVHFALSAGLIQVAAESSFD